jgi:hypothetical protein
MQKRHIRRTADSNHTHDGKAGLVRTERRGYRKTWWETRCRCGRLAPEAEKGMALAG